MPPRVRRCPALEKVDAQFAELQVWMGTPKATVAARFGVSVRTLNKALGIRDE
jgi:hypothetical protein